MATKSPPSTASKMTPEDRKKQYEILSKYRQDGTIPAINKVSRETGVSYTTIAMFMQGNSTNPAIRTYIKLRLTKNLKPLPDEVQDLFDIWGKDE